MFFKKYRSHMYMTITCWSSILSGGQARLSAPTSGFLLQMTVQQRTTLLTGLQMPLLHFRVV